MPFFAFSVSLGLMQLYCLMWKKPLIGVLFIAYNQTEPARKHLTGSAIGVKQC
jgi:hypothetical protein